ncbi:uncharacterized protein LOC135105628 isoform X1 [Scylla paramamosain]|uniref:uncharacterized protein LOC135105628 isoform X1 n=1 Tax=Scylla paramamosain TaxID=85552 RepID=UPI00308343D4
MTKTNSNKHTPTKHTCSLWQICVAGVAVLGVVVSVEVWWWWWWCVPNTTTTMTLIKSGMYQMGGEEEGRGRGKNELLFQEEEEEEEEEMPVKGYTFPNCDCIRFGVDIARMAVEARSQWRGEESQWGGSGEVRSLLHPLNTSGHSTCSDFATQRGGGQKVIAYSYYSTEATTDSGSTHYKKYLGSLHKQARRIAKAYPGFLMRVYHNVSATDDTATAFLCRLVCTHAHVDLCDVTRLPVLGNLVRQGVVGRAWRFAVLGDPTVDLFLSRDSDSWLLDREVAAVQEWLSSDLTFHVMRDHPNHKAVMLAGLWGGINKRPKKFAAVRNVMFSQPTNLTRKYDQYLLATFLWPLIKNDTLQHDSYTCTLTTHLGSIPFPTKREEDLYCGCGPYKSRERFVLSRSKCPHACRPTQHQSWTLC